MDISNVFATQLTSSAVVVFLMQKLKSASWFPLVQEGRALLNRAISIGAAFFFTIGIAYTWSVDPNGIHHLAFEWGSWSALAIAAFHGFWHWLNQYALQEMVYQGVANKPGITTDPTGAIAAKVAPGGALVVPATTP